MAKCSKCGEKLTFIESFKNPLSTCDECWEKLEESGKKQLERRSKSAGVLPAESSYVPSHQELSSAKTASVENSDEGAGIAQWIYPSKLLSTPQSAFTAIPAQRQVFNLLDYAIQDRFSACHRQYL